MIPEQRLLEMQSELLIGVHQPINDSMTVQSFLFAYSYYSKQLEEAAAKRRQRASRKVKIGG